MTSGGTRRFLLMGINSRLDISEPDTIFPMEALRRNEGGASLGVEPLVSIVTPVLNRASTLKMCLASVSAQTYPNIEHIVIDGGSTDGTVELLKSLPPRASLQWVTGRDDGMYDAINKGLSLARGEVLAYLNSDDLYLPWSVDVAIQEIRKGSDLVYGDLGVLNMIDESTTGFYIQFYPSFNLRYYTHVASMAQPTVFWRRSITEKIGEFDTSYKLIGDCEYWLRTAASGAKLSHVDEVIAIQFDHGDTLRATQSRRMAEEFQRVRARYRKYATPPRHPKLHSSLRSLRWRLYQWRFLFTSARREPKRWSRFISFLRDRGIQVNRFSTLLFFTLPMRLRPPNATWVDTTMFEEHILDEIGVRGVKHLAPPLAE